jgi:hypothetical protein
MTVIIDEMNETYRYERQIYFNNKNSSSSTATKIKIFGQADLKSAIYRTELWLWRPKIRYLRTRIWPFWRVKIRYFPDRHMGGPQQSTRDKQIDPNNPYKHEKKEDIVFSCNIKCRKNPLEWPQENPYFLGFTVAKSCNAQVKLK